MKKIKQINSDYIFYLSIILLPFENFFFAPSSGWATITPILLFVYIMLNFKNTLNCIIKHKRIVVFFLIGILLSIINFTIVGFNLLNVINTLIPIGLGFTTFFSFDIYYSRHKNIDKIIKLLLLSYTIVLIIGAIQFITIKFDIDFLYNFFDLIFKRNYLQHNRVQYFFTEPSFIGMHLFGILLPIYFISKNKKIIYLITIFCISAVVFSSGVRILLDICVVGFILLVYYLINKKKYKIIFAIPILIIVSFAFLYNNNYRVKQIADKGIYADGSLASRYFRIQSSVYGYIEKPIQTIFGYGIGNSLIPLRDGYDEAVKTYKSTYIKEVLDLGDPNYNDDSVSYCLYIRFISEFGIVMLTLAIIYIIQITKKSGFKYKYPYLLITAYLYVQFESYAFYSLWLFILIMLNTNKEEINKLKRDEIMKKVLVFGITDNPGGVESVIMNYYRSIDRDKIQFDFLCNTEKVAYEDEIKKLGGTIYRITARSNNYRLYKKEMNDFFMKHSNEYSTIWMNTCSLANIDYLKYAKKYGIKYRIIHSHNSQNMDSKLRGLLHKFNKLFIKKYATDFWSCGDDAGKWFYNDNIINSKKYLKINNAINTNKYKYNSKDRDKYRKQLNIENKIVVGNVGRFHFQKNQEFLIDIFNELHSNIEESVLLLVGDGEDYNKIQRKVESLGLNDCVKFVGVRNDVEKIMQAMDLFIFPSVFEGLGLVLVEAQAANLLIYASKDVIPNEVKFNNERFKFIPLANNPKEWVNEIVKDLDKIETRKDDYDSINKIKKAGYDIETEAEKIQKYLERA